jgi:hypothetical protein
VRKPWCTTLREVDHFSTRGSAAAALSTNIWTLCSRPGARRSNTTLSAPLSFSGRVAISVPAAPRVAGSASAASVTTSSLGAGCSINCTGTDGGAGAAAGSSTCVAGSPKTASMPAIAAAYACFVVAASTFGIAATAAASSSTAPRSMAG